MRVDDIYLDKDGNYLGTDGASTNEVRVIDKSAWGTGGAKADAQRQSAEGTSFLQNASTKLKEYKDGINISSETKKTVMKEGGEYLVPSVENNSDFTISYKPEGTIGEVEDAGAYPLEPNSDLYLPVDGVASFDISPNSVFKAVDGQQITVENNGFSASTILTDDGIGVGISLAGQIAKGGQYNSPPAPNWNKLYEKSVKDD